MNEITIAAQHNDGFHSVPSRLQAAAASVFLFYFFVNFLSSRVTYEQLADPRGTYATIPTETFPKLYH